jgi:CheY-like chemotaxis protein
MPHGGRLILETANLYLDDEYATTHLGVLPGHYIIVAVTDTGAGMDEATKARIFEPFFTTKEQGKGTGLGPSIVYGIVKQNGGEVFVYSEPGQGTVFKIYLPAVPAAAEIPAVEKAVAQSESVSETVLVVEDDEQLRKLARVMLGQQGYRVLDAGSPSDALRVIREHRGAVDLLLTDMVMPQMTGVELAAEIQKEYPQIKVLLMSGYTEGGVMNQGMITPETPFLRKPFTSVELDSKIREVLHGSRGAGQ